MLKTDRLIVACVLHDKAFRGRHYSAEWVLRLRAMVARNLTVPHLFVCLSNAYVPGVERISLKHDWPGWWSKIELFGPSFKSEGRVFYLDLDVIINGNLDEMVSDPSPMILLPPHHLILGIPPIKKKGVVRRYQTSCMLWTPSEGRRIYDEFRPEFMQHLRGDQDWIATIKPDCPTYPLSLVKKLGQCTRERPSPDIVKLILAVGGKNEEGAARFRWIREIWHRDDAQLGLS
jgi:hypothetical protein